MDVESAGAPEGKHLVMSDNTSNSAQDSGMPPIQHDSTHVSTIKNDALNDQEQVQVPKTDGATPVHDTAVVQNNPEPEAQLHGHQPPTSTSSQTDQTNPPTTSTAASPQAPVATVPAQTPCYTTCQNPTSSSTTTISCANPACPRQHFHLPCARLQQAPDPSSNWVCTLCTGWAAVLDRDPGDPADDIWRCPKCHAEVVHDDDDDGDWLGDGGLSQEPTGCKACGLRAGEPWEPRRKEHKVLFAAELAAWRVEFAREVRSENAARDKRALARAQRGVV